MDAFLPAAAFALAFQAASLHFALDRRQNTEPLAARRSEQVRLLEKLNRTDTSRLKGLQQLVIPSRWDLPELAYSPLPVLWPGVVSHPKFLLVHQPLQAFGAYEHGRLVRWGPVSTGRSRYPTPEGLFHLNWRSRGRTSTDNPDWYLRWYYNFENRRGLSFHSYSLPGYPASHGCIRMLDRDARWLYDWGEGWKLSADGRDVLAHGTPVLILGKYPHTRPPVWQDAEPLRVELPDRLEEQPLTLAARAR